MRWLKLVEKIAKGSLYFDQDISKSENKNVEFEELQRPILFVVLLWIFFSEIWRGEIGKGKWSFWWGHKKNAPFWWGHKKWEYFWWGHIFIKAHNRHWLLPQMGQPSFTFIIQWSLCSDVWLQQRARVDLQAHNTEQLSENVRLPRSA